MSRLFSSSVLTGRTLADLLACALRRRCRPLRCRSRAIYSPAAPAPYARCCCGRLFTIRTCQRDSRSFLAYILFQALLRYGDLPVVKTKIRCLCNLFAIADSLLSFQIKNGLPISRFAALLRLDTRFGALQQSLIAKKLQFRAFFCFWAPEIASNDAAG